MPAGDPVDRTRDPRMLDAIAAFLRACGVRDLADAPPAQAPRAAASPLPLLLPP